MRRAAVLLIVPLLMAAQPTVHAPTGAERAVNLSGSCGSGNTNVSGATYAPAFDVFLLQKQENIIILVSPSGTCITYRTITGCTGSDQEGIFLVDPYNERGFGDVLMVQSEGGKAICEYSLSGIVNGDNLAAAHYWVMDPLLGTVNVQNEGAVFIPGDSNCPSSKHGGCFLFNMYQSGRTLHRMQIDGSDTASSIGSEFNLDSLCGAAGDLADLQYDFVNDRLYLTNDDQNWVCVVNAAMDTLIEKWSYPYSDDWEAFAFGHGVVVFADDSAANPDYTDISMYRDRMRDLPGLVAKLVIDESKIPDGAPLTNFPMLVVGGAQFKGMFQADAGDIWFELEDGTRLTHEIVSADRTTGAFEAWVLIPTLDDDANTTLYMHYADPNAANQFDTTGAVWASEYLGVYHMEGGSGTAYLDASGNSNTLTPTGTPTLDGTGHIGDGIAVVRSSSILTHPIGASWNFDTQDMTICAWFKITDWAGGADEHIFSHGSGGSVLNERFYWREEASGTRVASRVGTTNPTDDNYTTSADTWYRACTVVNTDGATGGTDVYYAYQNATVFTQVNGITYTPFTTHAVADWTLGGAVHATDGYGEGMTGMLDEVWISQSAKTAAQITAEYNNQSSPTTFYTMTYEAGEDSRRHIQ